MKPQHEWALFVVGVDGWKWHFNVESTHIGTTG